MTIVVRSPESLITAVPYLLGFRPQESLVAVGVRDRAVMQVVRFDLPTDAGPDWLADVITLLRRGGAGEFHLLGYADRAPCGPVLAVLGRRLRRAGFVVSPVIVVTEDHWSHARCPSRRCCPPGGRPLAPDDSVAAEFVGRGSAPLPSRDALAASVAPVPMVSTGSGDLSSGDWSPAIEDWRDLADVDASWTPEPARVHRLALSLTDRAWRDALLRTFVPGLLGVDGLPPEYVSWAEAAVGPPRAPFGDWLARRERVVIDRLILVARRSPAPLTAGTYTTLGVVAAMWGHGALANLALEQALRTDPDYVLARLTLQVLGLGMPLAPLSSPGADVG